MQQDTQSAVDKEQDWAEKAADLVEQVANTLRQKGIEPLFRIGRLMSYGIIALLAGVIVLVVTMTVIVRLLTDYAFGHHVWITYLLIGGITLTLGMFLMKKMKSYDI
jgi:hypothetical protein